MTHHTVGTRKEWLAARVALLEQEKELTRRTDGLNGTWQLLDRTPKGRFEGASPGWPLRSNEYESARATA